MSLCFCDAFEEKKNGAISEEEYFHHLLAHCRGVKHEEEGDEWPGGDSRLAALDLVGYSIKTWSLSMPHIKRRPVSKSYVDSISDNLDTTPLK